MKKPGKKSVLCFMAALSLWVLASCYEQYPYFIQVPEFHVYFSDDGSGDRYLSIFTPDKRNSIRYTTDGSDPSESYGNYYDGSILLTGELYVRATAYREGYSAGPITDFYYNPND